VAGDSSPTSYPSMISKSHQLEPEDAESKYILIYIQVFLFFLILTIAVSDNPSAPATITYRDSKSAEPLYHLDARPSPETKQKETPEMKRKETPATTSTETTVVTKRIKAEGSGSSGRIRAGDFNDLTRSIIEETISIYRAQIGSVEAFPERADDRNTVKQAWLEVCSGRNLRVELEEDIFKLVSDSGYFLLFVTMISPCRLSDVHHKQEDMLKRCLGHILYLHTRLTAMDQDARFVTQLNNYWKALALFTR
jgi:hypothetical protein